MITLIERESGVERNPEILREKTIDDKLIYIPNDVIHSYLFFRIKLLV